MCYWLFYRLNSSSACCADQHTVAGCRCDRPVHPRPGLHDGDFCWLSDSGRPGCHLGDCRHLFAFLPADSFVASAVQPTTIIRNLLRYFGRNHDCFAGIDGIRILAIGDGHLRLLGQCRHFCRQFYRPHSIQGEFFLSDHHGWIHRLAGHDVLNVSSRQKAPHHLPYSGGDEGLFLKLQNISLLYFHKNELAFIKQIEGAVQMIRSQRNALLGFDHV